ncbi:beta-lactamase family protein [Nocardia huaxiensis]|uniref:Beta-lactamase family protein n=1 Tax=Nocardia huaxiensis TaxID=2755382 RepID=A0A7D6VBA3_9NOCA|nr:beta-lactamase family protein [Nocardia huaxiensis]
MARNRDDDMGDSSVRGTSEPEFAAAVAAFENLFAGGRGGGALAVYHRGRRVVDVWTGTADAAGTRPWRENTAAVTYSTSKGITAAVVHTLAARGLIDYHAPVAEYWPEFGARQAEDHRCRTAEPPCRAGRNRFAGRESGRIARSSPDGGATGRRPPRPAAHAARLPCDQLRLAGSGFGARGHRKRDGRAVSNATGGAAGHHRPAPRRPARRGGHRGRRILRFGNTFRATQCRPAAADRLAHTCGPRHRFHPLRLHLRRSDDGTRPGAGPAAQ